MARTRPANHQGGGIAPNRQSQARGGAFAVSAVAEQVETARFHAKQAHQRRGQGCAHGQAKAAVARQIAAKLPLPVGQRSRFGIGGGLAGIAIVNHARGGLALGGQYFAAGQYIGAAVRRPARLCGYGVGCMQAVGLQVVGQ